MGFEFAQQLVTAGTIALNTTFFGSDLTNAGHTNINDTKPPTVGLDFENSVNPTQEECIQTMRIDREIDALEVLLGDGPTPEPRDPPEGCEKYFSLPSSAPSM